ncbi:lipoate--protein ligase family protein [Puniceicoccus vermicola]|uniref:BPL/LPL catalytic domain-containing protein n=1 Tax=Puniceicoccus vermicola TaxID=388746 RepID=A0A7X1AXR3_9BACT|nr:hypothetical protein [Puniceicoccus vermicola]MBC2601945.1 hypothetical protein [Puniceicoccus vermicola]
MTSPTAPPEPTERLAWISCDDDPARYSAIEEACLRDSQESFLILWINRPALFVGKNQNLWAEVSAAEAFHTGISLNRRLSGGGTVYHDPGNLNFTMVSPGEPKIAFQEHLSLLFPYFEARGIAVEIRNRSDLFHDGRKFSGNAEYFTGGRVLHHGTLLFNTDLPQLARFLTPDSNAYTDRAVDSNRSLTVNLCSLLPDIPNTRTFAEDLLNVLLGHHSNLRRIEEMPSTILRKAEDYLPHFRDPAWIFGRSPRYELERTVSRDSESMSSRISVQDGQIQEIHLESRANESPEELQTIADSFRDCLHSPEAIQSRIQNSRWKDFPSGAFLSKVWLELFF